MGGTLKDQFIDAAAAEFRYYKKIAEDAIAQVNWKRMQKAPGSGLNSIAVIMKHMAGNMRSRWTDFLTTDGEKPWRNRDQEFVDDLKDRDQLMGIWAEGWGTVFATLEELRGADLTGTVTIRTQPVKTTRAIQRQVAHYGYHVGQIVLIARMYTGRSWDFLSLPPGTSEEFNEAMRRRYDE